MTTYVTDTQALEILNANEHRVSFGDNDQILVDGDVYAPAKGVETTARWHQILAHRAVQFVLCCEEIAKIQGQKVRAPNYIGDNVGIYDPFITEWPNTVEQINRTYNSMLELFRESYDYEMADDSCEADDEDQG